MENDALRQARVLRGSGGDQPARDWMWTRKLYPQLLLKADMLCVGIRHVLLSISAAFLFPFRFLLFRCHKPINLTENNPKTHTRSYQRAALHNPKSIHWPWRFQFAHAIRTGEIARLANSRVSRVGRMMRRNESRVAHVAPNPLAEERMPGERAATPILQAEQSCTGAAEFPDFAAIGCTTC